MYMKIIIGQYTLIWKKQMDKEIMIRTSKMQSQKFETATHVRVIPASGSLTEKKSVWIAIPERSWPWRVSRDRTNAGGIFSPVGRYQRMNDINTAPSCTSYINIMLSRFLVKHTLPRETVASATAETGYRRRQRCQMSKYNCPGNRIKLLFDTRYWNRNCYSQWLFPATLKIYFKILFII